MIAEVKLGIELMIQNLLDLRQTLVLEIMSLKLFHSRYGVDGLVDVVSQDISIALAIW